MGSSRADLLVMVHYMNSFSTDWLGNGLYGGSCSAIVCERDCMCVVVVQVCQEWDFM